MRDKPLAETFAHGLLRVSIGVVLVPLALPVLLVSGMASCVKIGLASVPRRGSGTQGGVVLGVPSLSRRSRLVRGGAGGAGRASSRPNASSTGPGPSSAAGDDVTPAGRAPAPRPDADSGSVPARGRGTPPGSSSPGSSGSPTHLFVLIHGLGGTPDDLACLRKNLVGRGGSDVLVLAPGCNAATRSFDGVPAGAERVAEEIRAVVEAHPTLRRISLVGNSLGGIYARYVAALLYEGEEGEEDPGPGPGRGAPAGEDKDECRGGRIAGLVPATFLTTATPHLGVGPFGYLGLVPSPIASLGASILGASTRQLALADADGDGGRPLLVAMADAESAGATADGAARSRDGATRKRGTLPFIRALASFERRCAYANAKNDFLVAYETASLDVDATFADGRREGKGARIVGERDHVPGGPSGADADVERGGTLARRRTCAEGLKTLTWHHVDVEFPGWAPLAHNKICALQRDPITEWLFKEGEFIVEHQAGYLLEHVAGRDA